MVFCGKAALLVPIHVVHLSLREQHDGSRRSKLTTGQSEVGRPLSLVGPVIQGSGC